MTFSFNIITQTVKNYLWLLAALLFGLSWPLFQGIDSSYLAWFSFAVLFFQIREIQNFRKYYLIVLAFLYISHFIVFWWVFNIPKNRSLVLLATIHDTFIVSIPYVILFLLKKRISFKYAIISIAFIIPAWEWVYTELENTIGFMNIGYSQGNNKNFIQMANISGVYGISFLVWTINCLIFYALDNLLNKKFSRLNFIIFISIVLVIIPYGKYSSISKTTDKEINVLLTNTNYSPIKISESYWNDIYEDILDKTDIKIKQTSQKTDLIIWPESIINEYSNEKHEFLKKKTNIWNSSLLFGVKYTDSISTFNQMLLIDNKGISQKYNKVKLTPFWEGIPFLSHYFKFDNYLQPGKSYTLFNSNNFKFGTPICFELLYPSVWIKMKQQGAQYFIQPSYESWFGELWFRNVFVSISKFRAIETGNTIIRCSNGGSSGIIYPKKENQIINNEIAFIKVDIHTHKTIYEKMFYLLPVIFFSLFLISILFLYRKTQS